MTNDPRTILVLIIACLNTILAIFIFSKNRRSRLSFTFGLMTFLVGLWSVFAFAFRSVPFDSAPVFGYLLYTAAALLPISFLAMTLAFPPVSWLSNRLIFWMLLETVFILWIINTPGFVIRGLTSDGQERILLWGKYYFIYFLHIVTFFLIGYLVLIKKLYIASGIERQQVKYIILGTILPANVAMATNLVLPWFGYYDFYTWAGQACMIFLVLFSGYAILKHHLFEIKIIATELFTVATSITLLVRVFLPSGYYNKSVDWVIFVLVSVFGYLLIRSVLKEVQQKDKLEVISAQLQKANTELQTLDKARAEFVSIASHQLRTPPATIKWYLAAVLAGDFGPLEPKVREAIKKAEYSNNSLISLIDDLLNVSRIERGKMEFIYETGSLEEIVKSVVLQLEPEAASKNLKLRVSKPTRKVPKIVMDREKLKQVINNLVDNAIKYSDKGTVTVALEVTKTDVLVKVTDRGKGIKPEEIEDIFSKFKRGSGSVHHGAGLGLGLYVARVIAEHHNGSLTVQSEGENKGSTFILRLPLKSDLKKEVFDLTKEN